MEKLYDLSNPQKNIWSIEQYYNGTNINNICAILMIKQDVDLEKLNQAVNIFVKNNKSFGLDFKYQEGTLVQYFTEQEKKECKKVKLKDYKEVQKFAKQMTEKIFNIFDKELYEFVLFKLDNGYGGFIILAHHIISDAATFALIGTEIVENYVKVLKNEEIEIKDYSYKDYLLDEKEYVNSNRFKKDGEYWNNLYETIPEVASIPSLKANKNVNSSGKANRKEYIIKKDLLNKINEFCKKNKLSNFNFFMAVYAIYLSRVSNLTDFVIGTPILNRSNFKEKHTTGMFINTAALRIKIDHNISFLAFVKQIAKNSLSMLRYQKYPYETLIKDLRKKQKNLPTLFDVMLSYQITKANNRNIEIPYEVEWIPTPNIVNGMYIHLHDNNDDESIYISYDYQVEKYIEEDVKNMHMRVLHIIEQVLENENCLEKDIEIITKEEKNKILNEFNNTNYKFNLHNVKNIINLIEKEAKTHPNNIAIEDETKTISYKELIKRVNKLSNYLLKEKIPEGSNIGILTNKSIDTIVGILAILKINCTIVPIDPNYPTDRINYMIKNSNINLLLINNTKFTYENLKIIDISYDNYCKENTKITKKFKFNINNNVYIIFTSGSTGNPKGVMISNKNLLNLVEFEKEKLKIISDKSRVLQFATMSFDVSYQEIFSTLTRGATLVLIDDNVKKDKNKLTNYIIDKNIDTLFIPPRYLQLLLEENNKFDKVSQTLKNIITAGEQLIITSKIKEIIDTGVLIHNHYGPAETHVCTTYTINGKNESEFKPPIGKPISNSRIYILDSSKNLCPIGISGELYISGECVGNGYVNKKDLTDERFLEDPFFKDNKMYKTGDLARYNNDGNIYYIGRSDFQVKVNGFRIELEEVEHNILKLPYIDSAFVTVEKNELEKNILIAFVKFSENIQEVNIKKDLLKYLPKYMIPNMLYKVDKIPLNHNGKIDKKYLLSNRESFKLLSETSGKKVEATTDLEKKLLKIFKKILNINNLSAIDDFFDLGGDSLSAIALQAECAKNNIFFNTQDLYDNPNIVALANYLSNPHSNNLLASEIDVKLKAKNIKLKKRNNIFLTGSTGFLGIHVLNSLLNTKNNIYCLVRSTSNKSSEQRLIEMYKYYFSVDISKDINSKIFIIDGELSNEKFGLNEKDYKHLAKKIDIIINCAASVKHYTTRKYNYTHNVLTTKNLLDFAEAGKCYFNHISTIGIAGNDLVNTNKCIKDTFCENDLYIGQDYKSNVYVETKFDAENMIIERIQNKKIYGNILRVGNLMNRYSDNKFQINRKSNAFQNKIRAISNLKIIPQEFCDFSYDLTPVDLCGQAIVLLALNKSYNNIYHVLNPDKLTFKDIKTIFKELNIDIKFIRNDQMSKNLISNELSSNDENYKWIINDIILHNVKRISINSDKTQSVLKSLGFTWNFINNNYYKKVFEYILKGDVQNKKVI